ncbi:hypothetical protein COU79_04055 [Candidatus Peregrinibacteria bacterium CG10_big_fil_rev_8_21_14_0_10_54_7]|nr:MAG: hypothetical protein COU79_04055 [Candidatus Peregrinibacteria bacterium CG10_big_fil_rev_8_21_14_0_10_54_7]
MPTPAFHITCTKNALIAQDVYEMRFRKPTDFSYKAGQFILFDVPLVENPEDIQTRAYSIASAPHEKDLLFIVKLLEGGRASRWVKESLSEGDTVRMQGPFGRFLLDDEEKSEFLFLCTSTGIAPFRSHVLEALHTGDTRTMDLMFGNRFAGDLFWMEEFEKLALEHPSFSFYPVLSKPTGAWKGHKGHVQDIALQITKDLTKKRIYICGSPAMTDELKQLCLASWNIPKENLHVEGFI